MYVPATNSVYRARRRLRRAPLAVPRPPTQGLVGNARSPGNNRSVTMAGDKVFLQTDHAHLIALNRFTGQVLWDTEMADYRQNYNATGSLLAVENLVVAGTAGGEQGVRGFLAAYDQATGKEVWRTWTIPARGEKGSETWDGIDIDHGGGPTWLTGSYDPTTRPSTGPPATPDPISTATTARATTCTPAPSSPSTSPPESSSGTTRPLRTTSGTGTLVQPAGARRRQLAGPAAQAAAPGQPQRLPLRPRPSRRQTAAAPNRWSRS